MILSNTGPVDVPPGKLLNVDIPKSFAIDGIVDGFQAVDHHTAIAGLPAYILTGALSEIPVGVDTVLEFDMGTIPSGVYPIRVQIGGIVDDLHSFVMP